MDYVREDNDEENSFETSLIDCAYVREIAHLRYFKATLQISLMPQQIFVSVIVVANF